MDRKEVFVLKLYFNFMKKYIDIYNNSSSVLFSFEFFPPKNQDKDIKLYESINNITELEPDFFYSYIWSCWLGTREKFKYYSKH